MRRVCIAGHALSDLRGRASCNTSQALGAGTPGCSGVPGAVPVVASAALVTLRACEVATVELQAQRGRGVPVTQCRVRPTPPAPAAASAFGGACRKPRRGPGDMWHAAWRAGCGLGLIGGGPAARGGGRRVRRSRPGRRADPCPRLPPKQALLTQPSSGRACYSADVC
jgi:hypothetical protein